MRNLQSRRRIRAIALVLALGWAVSAAPAPVQLPAFVKETAANLPGYNIYRPADLARRRSPAPVVVWANGGCVKRDATWSSLFERWAGAGYVVVTIHDPNATSNMEAMARQMAAARGAAEAGGQTPAGAAPSPEARARMLAMAGMAAKDAAEAQRKAIDWAVTENAARGGAWRGKLDTRRIVAAGNSCGGISSLNLAASEPRVKSVYVLSGSSVGPGATSERVAQVMGKVTVPTIWIVGGPEDIARAAADMDYSLQPEGKPGVVIYRNQFDHPKVSTDPGALRDAAEIGLNWFRATLYNDRRAARELTTGICQGCDAQTWTVKAKHIGGAPR